MDKRVILLTFLSVAILIGWSYLVAPLLLPKPPARDGKKGPAPVPSAKDEEPAWTEVRKPQAEPTAPTAAVPEPQGVALREDLVLENGRLRATLTNRGAGVLKLELRYPDEARNVVLLDAYDPDRPHLSVRAVGEPDPLDTNLWRHEERFEEGIQRHVFTRSMANGLDLEKQFWIEKDDSFVRMKLAVINPNREQRPLRLEVFALNGMDHDGGYRYEIYTMGIVGTRAGRSHTLQFVPVGDPGKQKASEFAEAGVSWCGLRNRYFAAAVIPAGDAPVEKVAFIPLSPEARKRLPLPSLNARIVLKETPVETRQAWEFALHAVPLEGDALAKAGHGMPALLNYGSGCFLLGPIVGLVAPALLWILGLFHSVFGNTGVAIIFTTLVVRGVLFPLSCKSAISMARMAELQPKMQILRERYKEDPKKQNQEVMKLWKEHGVNPLSGCLPILLQLPIWIGMYSVIDLSIQFREAPFLLWIDDLSQPDRLIHFGSPVPLLLFSVHDLNLLPILMTITWFLQSYFAPRPVDPQMAMQQKILLIMPVVFGLMCYTLASGLSLYFFMNSLFGMGEQKLIRRIWIQPRKA